MAFTKIDHVGLLVDDLEVGRHVFCEGWGLAVDEHRSPWPQGRQGTFDGVTSIEIPIGEMYLEISKPNDSASPAAQFVSERRSGMYYMSFASDDIVRDVRMLKENGITVHGEWNGEGPVFLDLTTTLGLLIQVVPHENYFVHPYYKGDGTFTGMAHVGLAARDEHEVRDLFARKFGLREDLLTRSQENRPAAQARQPERDPNRAAGDPVHILEFPVGGSVLEISIPTTDDSGTARLVAQRATLGAVYHHICPFAPDVHRAVEMGKVAGLQQIGTIPPREQTTRATAWFHPRTCAGTLIEIWNRPPGVEHFESREHHHPAQ
ncbi:MAG TPA: VOC family protein [Dehalococcoidia bacterium]|nr:VOC family protein [Dehalococcoidia bacterium]